MTAKLRVKVATGGDPSFPLRVNLRGEQVLGLGGAYRHFMWIMGREVQSSHLGLFVPCPSAAANKNKVSMRRSRYLVGDMRGYKGGLFCIKLVHDQFDIISFRESSYFVPD